MNDSCLISLIDPVVFFLHPLIMSTPLDQFCPLVPVFPLGTTYPHSGNALNKYGLSTNSKPGQDTRTLQDHIVHEPEENTWVRTIQCDKHLVHITMGEKRRVWLTSEESLQKEIVVKDDQNVQRWTWQLGAKGTVSAKAWNYDTAQHFWKRTRSLAWRNLGGFKWV